MAHMSLFVYSQDWSHQVVAEAAADSLVVVQPRSFLELQDFLLSLELPDATRQAWQEVL